MSQKKIRSILDEMDDLLPPRDKHIIVEARASHVIASAINLIDMINENFSPEEAEELNRRLYLSIKNNNPRKFENGIRKLKEDRDGK